MAIEYRSLQMYADACMLTFADVRCCLQSTGVSFDVTPPKGKASCTPSKLMLMNRERKMNMLSPEGGQSLFHTDIETGK